MQKNSNDRKVPSGIFARKLFLIMRLTLIALFTSTLSLFATGSYSQNTKISLDLKSVTVKDALKAIESSSEFYFIYNNELINVNRTVDINVKNEKISNILNTIFSGKDIEISVIDRKIVLAPASMSSQQTGKKVTGKVTDSSGALLPGVAVVVKGTTNGVITDNNGNFSLSNIPESAILQFSFVGMKGQEITVGVKTSFNVSLADESIGIEEVVAVGYGTQKKATSTGSILAVKGTELIKSPTMNVSNSLEGRISGLVTQTVSGEPGYDGTTLRIRGVNTLGNNNPLVVIDGVPGRSLDRIDPSTIESLTVLKDASGAIYGAQAANGVILITTKRGKIGKPTITANFNQGYSRPTRIPKMSNSFEYATLLNEVDGYAGNAPRYNPQQLQKFQDGTDQWEYPNTDWFKETLKPWSKQNYTNASISGGSENMKYFVSVGAKSQDGFYYNSGTKYNQYDLRSNLDGNINKYISIGVDISGRMEDRNFPTRSAGDIFRMVMRGKPIYNAYWPNGMPGPDIEYGNNPVVVSTKATGYDQDKTYVFNSNFKVDIKIPWIEGLSIKGNAAIDKNFRFHKNFQIPWYLYSFQGFDSSNQPILQKGKKGVDDPRLFEEMGDNLSILLNGLVNYEHKFGDHNVKMMVGAESIKGSGDNFNGFRRYFLSTTIDQMFAGGDKEKTTTGSAYKNARLNYFGRANYNYKEKYLAEFVWRYQGSYIFDEASRFGFFPGASLGYRISEENFWKENLKVINDFKLRLSFGQTGNDQIDEWQYMSSYGFNNNIFVTNSDMANKALYEARIPNKNVSWEIANQSDIGFDAELFEGKLSVTADYFDYRRSQILWYRNASVPSSTGLTLPRENIGKVSNKGFDFNIGYRNQLNDFKYQISLNGGYQKNKIIFWDESPGAPDYQLSTNHPMNTNLYYNAIGIFKDQAAVNAYPHWSDARPGDIIFEDVSGDGKIDANDRVRFDKTDLPTFTSGFAVNVQWKGFDFSMLLQASLGAVRYINTESGEIGNYLKDFYDNRWTAQNTDASYPRTFNRDNVYWRPQQNTFWMHKTDNMRLKNIEVGYNIPAILLQKIGVQNLRLYVSGYNMFTYSPDLKDFDPEQARNDGQGYPLQKIANFGVNITF